MSLETDFIVIGSGIAGLRAAIELAGSGARVTVLTKDRTGESNTEYAQGGIAVVLSDDDRAELHEEDTLYAGDGLCDVEAVRTLVTDGTKYIQELMEWGTKFDREGGKLVFTQEAAHSRRRILHANGDSTGKEIARSLIARARREKNISVMPFAATESLIVQDGRCCGVTFLDPILRAPRDLFGKAVILASGGAGQLYLHTTNPSIATGDGMAMAYFVGAEIADIEFVQFHPTVLNLENAPRFLLSEAMRGEGGVLRNKAGERFMERYHELKELAPRDVVSRAIVAEMTRTGTRTVFLDMSAHDEKFLAERFPNIYQTCLNYGLNIAKDRLPISPAVHYFMGGVRTDLDGRSTLPGLYAAGEVACTGVHGANRLASNSLLEGLVFGARAGKTAAECSEFKVQSSKTHTTASNLKPGTSNLEPGSVATAVRKRVKRLMWERVGILREENSLKKALAEFEQISQAPLSTASRNFVTLAKLITAAALWREESRGGHYRTDFPARDDEHWQAHSIQKLQAGIAAEKQINFAALRSHKVK
ncbi:MAG TPA: L-aspartate oxidase [Pyrinomonadaceae bacterium]|jgi:L-aspartate oxidase|nr:L-aspartate oxidase [Pyrinomonadaceae bacterium]